MLSAGRDEPMGNSLLPQTALSPHKANIANLLSQAAHTKEMAALLRPFGVPQPHGKIGKHSITHWPAAYEIFIPHSQKQRHKTEVGCGSKKRHEAFSV